MFGLPIAGLIIIAVIAFEDYKYAKRKQHFKQLVNMSVQKHGKSVIVRILNKCIETKLSLNDMIDVFEYSNTY